jgi:hypothetical protein
VSDPIERRFTLEEAEAALTDLRPRLERLRDARRLVLSAGERIRKRASRNGGGAEGSAYWEAIRTLRAETEYLAEAGIMLRDAETGLVDFPSERDGETILLCWRLDEDHIGWWHRPETGFPGRQPL